MNSSVYLLSLFAVIYVAYIVYCEIETKKSIKTIESYILNSSIEEAYYALASIYVSGASERIKAAVSVFYILKVTGGRASIGAHEMRVLLEKKTTMDKLNNILSHRCVAL